MLGVACAGCGKKKVVKKEELNLRKKKYMCIDCSEEFMVAYLKNKVFVK